MKVSVCLPLLAVVLFCLTSMARCHSPNDMPGGQFTVVKGSVINLRTGRPLAGVQVAVLSAINELHEYVDVVDTVRTDAQGAYTLSFTNIKGLYYAVRCEGRVGFEEYRLDFPDLLVIGKPYSFDDRQREFDLTLGQTNVANFRPTPRRVVRMQVLTRKTGYQELNFYENALFLPADNQRRTVILYEPVITVRQDPQSFYQKPSAVPTARFIRNRSTTAYHDTTLRAKVSSPLTGDTIQATLEFGQ